MLQESKSDVTAKTPVVLVVDDQRLSLATTSSLAEAAGYRVLQAQNGQEALTMARSQQPNLVLLDMNMPEIDGWTVATHLRRLYRDQIGIVAITSYSLPGDEARALASGCDRFLSKPVRSDELLATMKDLSRVQLQVNPK